MTRRQRLGESRIAALFDPPSDQRETVRHWTMSPEDLAAVDRCRGDHNRLGYALMLCYLRYPGRVLGAGERPPARLLEFVAAQVDVPPDVIDACLAHERGRQRHAAECQHHLGLRPFGKRVAAELMQLLLPEAIENEQLLHLAELVIRRAGSGASSFRRRRRWNGSATGSGSRRATRRIGD